MQWLDHKYLGYNYRMDEMSAALGLTQLTRVNWFIKERRKLAQLYGKYFKKFFGLIQSPVVADFNTHTWFVYVVEIKNKKISRDKIIKQLKQEGISSKPYLPSIHLFDFYQKKFGFKKGDFPISENISQHGIALPFYIGLKAKDVKYIVNKFIEIIKNTSSVRDYARHHNNLDGLAGQ